MKSYTVGIAGPSSSGKSTLALRLARDLGEDCCHVLCLDSYLVKSLGEMVSPISQKAYHDFSNPVYLDLEQVLREIDTQAKKSRYLIVEGLSVLYFPQLRQRLNLKLFLTADPELRLYRRILRNTNRQDGSTVRSVGEYHLHSASIQESKYILPTRVYSDLILDGGYLTDLGVALLVDFLRLKNELTG